MFEDWLHSHKIEGYEQLVQNADEHLSGDWKYARNDDSVVLCAVYQDELVSIARFFYFHLCLW